MLTTEYSVEHTKIMEEASRTLTFEARIYNGVVVSGGNNPYVKFTGTTSINDAAFSSMSLILDLTQTALYSGLAYMTVGDATSATSTIAVKAHCLGFAKADGRQLDIRVPDSSVMKEARESNTLNLRLTLSPTDLQPAFRTRIGALKSKYRNLGLAV